MASQDDARSIAGSQAMSESDTMLMRASPSRSVKSGSQTDMDSALRLERLSSYKDHREDLKSLIVEAGKYSKETYRNFRKGEKLLAKRMAATRLQTPEKIDNSDHSPSAAANWYSTQSLFHLLPQDFKAYQACSTELVKSLNDFVETLEKGLNPDTEEWHKAIELNACIRLQLTTFTEKQGSLHILLKTALADLPAALQQVGIVLSATINTTTPSEAKLKSQLEEGQAELEESQAQLEECLSKMKELETKCSKYEGLEDAKCPDSGPHSKA